MSNSELYNSYIVKIANFPLRSFEKYVARIMKDYIIAVTLVFSNGF